MTAAMITAFLSLIQSILSETGVTSTVLTSIVNALEQFVPIVISVEPALAADVKNIITAIKNQTETPAELMAPLAAIDAQADSALDAAAAADGLSATAPSTPTA